MALPELSEPTAGNYFVSAYPPFARWSPERAGDFRRALRDAPPDPAPPLGLYVHIPFCVRRCDYCYYRSYADRPGEIDGYLDAVTRELGLYREQAALADRPLRFAYFGGGTPSLLSTSRLGRLLDGLQQQVSWDGIEEATFECAPLSVTPTKLALLRDAGITRISMGVQQLDDRVLRNNGRVHAVRDVLRAYAEIRRTGFATVNLDLIVGLVGETDDSFARSLEQTIELAPDAVTLYQLEIPYNTPLYRRVRYGTLPEEPADWPTKRDRLAWAFSRLEEAGYVVRSAYAAVRDPERHPFAYQDEQYRGADLLGIGLASFSYLAGVHHQNRTELEDYRACLDRGELPLGRAYVLDADERLTREFVLQLKLGAVDRERLRERYDVDVAERFAGPLEGFARAGWLTVEPDRVRLTREGLLRVDRMLPAFY